VRRLGCSGRGARSLTSLSLLGVSQQTLRKWSKQGQADRGERHDTLTSAERDELRRLRRENVGLKQERDVLKRATALFARETETR
jgi:transposase